MDTIEKRKAFWRILLPIIIVGGVVTIFEKGIYFGRWLYELVHK